MFQYSTTEKCSRSSNSLALRVVQVSHRPCYCGHARCISDAATKKIDWLRGTRSGTPRRPTAGDHDGPKDYGLHGG